MKKIIPLTILLASLSSCEKDSYSARANREPSHQETSENVLSSEKYSESEKARDNLRAKMEHSKKFREHFIGKEGETNVQQRNRYETVTPSSRTDNEPYVDPQDAEDFLNDPKVDPSIRVRFKKCPGLRVSTMLFDNECRSYHIDPLEYHSIELPDRWSDKKLGLDFLTRSDSSSASCTSLALVTREFAIAQENWDRYAEQMKLIDKVIVLKEYSRSRNELCGEDMVLGSILFEDIDAVRLLALSWYKHLPDRQEFEEKWLSCSYEKRADGSKKVASRVIDTASIIYQLNSPDVILIGFPNEKNLHEGRGLPPVTSSLEGVVIRYGENLSTNLGCVPCLKEALPKRIGLFLEYGFISQAEHDLALRELQGRGKYTEDDAELKYKERRNYLLGNSNRHLSSEEILDNCGENNLPREKSPYQSEESSDTEEEFPFSSTGGKKIMI